MGHIITGALTDSTNEFAQSAQGYASSSIEVSFNWKWELITTLRYWSFYISLIYILYLLFVDNNWRKCSFEFQSLLTFTLFIITIAVIVLVVAGNKMLGLWVIGYRYLYMAGIPLCLIITHLYQRQIIKDKQVKMLLLFPFLYAELFIIGKILTLYFD